MKKEFVTFRNSLLTILVVALAGCNYRVDKDSGNPPNDMPPAQKATLSYEIVREKVFGPRCVSCHGISGRLNLESYESIIANLDGIRRAVFVLKTMPKDRPLSSDEASLLNAWIEMGAPKDAQNSGSTSPGTTPTPAATPTPVPSSALSFEYVKQEVLQPKCINCHGTSGNVNLETFASVKSVMSGIIKAALINKTMPKDSSLTQAQYDILLNWIALGAPEKADGSVGTPEPKPTATPQPMPLEPTFSSIKTNIFTNRCLSCHSPTGLGANVSLSTREDLLNSPRDLVLPGNPDESGLVIAIERTDEKRMPPPSTGSALSGSEIKTIRDWITAGSKD
jgi:mono/diheme cytochrome c family protein